MTDLLSRGESDSLAISPTAIRWTRQDCLRLEESGLLDFRYELVEGVINRMGQGLGHANLIRLLTAWLAGAVGFDLFFTQATIDVRPEDNPTNEPQPDVIVLNRPADTLTEIPKPSDILLLIEAADSTTAYDLNTKAGLYARAGIPEYWVLSLPHRTLYVHRTPQNGRYLEVTAVTEIESVAPLAIPTATVQVATLFPNG